MKKEVIYKVLTIDNLNQYESELLELIDFENKRNEEIKISLRNSNYIIIALFDNKVIWSNQIITDNYFCAVLINLFVFEKYRWKWIWVELMKLTLKTVLDKWIKNISLVADPWSPWLTKFYYKYWFEDSKENWTYMWLNKNKINIKDLP